MSYKSLDVEWAPGWSSERVLDYTDTLNDTATPQTKVVGFKVPSWHIPLEKLRGAFDTGEPIRRARVRLPASSWQTIHNLDQHETLYPVPCTGTAVHLAIHPAMGFVSAAGQPYVGVMESWGRHGDDWYSGERADHTVAKWYGKSYRVVARLEILTFSTFGRFARGTALKALELV